MKKNKSILIIEDDLPILQVLMEKFSAEGYAVLQAKDGQEGLDLALKNKPDLILLDIIMPIMDGMTMLKKLRKDKWGKDVPVVLLTNLSDARSVAEAAESGVYDYLVKSNWRVDDVVNKVEERLK